MRVKEIKKWLRGNYVLKWSVRDNIKWLISELEKCRAEVLELEDQVKWLRHIWKQDEDEVKRLKAILAHRGIPC